MLHVMRNRSSHEYLTTDGAWSPYLGAAQKFDRRIDLIDRAVLIPRAERQRGIEMILLADDGVSQLEMTVILEPNAVMAG